MAKKDLTPKHPHDRGLSALSLVFTSVPTQFKRTAPFPTCCHLTLRSRFVWK